MKTLARNAALPLLLSLLLIGAAAAEVIPDFKANDETGGQEFQRDVTACTHPDGSWTTAWLDFRQGVPAIFMRSFDATDAPLDSSWALTGGLGLLDHESERILGRRPESDRAGRWPEHHRLE